MLLVSGCPILLSSLGGSEPDVFNDPSSAGSLWVCMGVCLAHYFKHMIFKTVLLWDNQQSQFIVLEAKEAH